MRFDSGLIAGQINFMVEAALVPKMLAGMVLLVLLMLLVPVGRWRIMLPILLFSGTLLNASVICPKFVPGGQVNVQT